MKQTKVQARKYNLSLGYSLVLHALLLLFIFVGFEQHIKIQISPPSTDIVQAQIVDEKLVVKEIQRIQHKDQQQKIQAQKLEALKKEQLQEQVRLQQLKKDLEKTRLEEEARLHDLKIAQEQERKKLSQLDEKRQEEQDRLNQVRHEREKEQKQQLELEQKKAAALDAAKAKLKTDIENHAKAESEFNESMQVWQGLFDGHWIKPPGTEGLLCELKVSVLPDGTVHQVQLLRSSGNAAYDDSAVKAVWKASPLRMPDKVHLVERLREVTFGFKNAENL